MVFTDGSSLNVLGGGPDASAEGRRERLQRKWDSREAFTGKVGQGPYVAAAAPAGAPAAPQAQVAAPPSSRGAAAAPSEGGRAAAAGGVTATDLFSVRTRVARHVFEAEVTASAQIRLLDVEVNEKRRTVCWLGESGVSGEMVISETVDIPRSFDLSQLTVDGSAMGEGRCKVQIPGAQQNVF